MLCYQQPVKKKNIICLYKKNAKENIVRWAEDSIFASEINSQRAINWKALPAMLWTVSFLKKVGKWTSGGQKHKRRSCRIYKLFTADEEYWKSYLKKQDKITPKSRNRTWDTPLTIQFIHLLFTEIYSEMVSVGGWL